jgi:tRNA threonylcarbamoyl adenosine modification protein YeaZ
MLILAIQSSLPIIEIALLENDTILFRKSWPSERNEVSKLLPEIESGLKENGYELKDIKKILAVKGPGAFSSTRIGVTIANTLAYAIQAELYDLDSGNYQKILEEIQKKDVKDSVEKKFGTRGEAKAELADAALFYFAEKTFLKPTPVQQIIPVYSSEAKITPSKKPKFV